MTALESSSSVNPRLGLCADCLHARLIESSKGSQFLLCQLSQSDPSFPKYPRLPILACTGYSQKPAK
jgi:hypothetical protein